MKIGVRNTGTFSNEDKNITRAVLATQPTEAWRRVSAGLRRILGINRQPHRLRVCESLSLGDRRFVAVVEFERSRFLLGGTAGSLVLLARLEGADDECQNEEFRASHSVRASGGPC